MKIQQKIALGSVLATTAGAGIILSVILEWTALIRPWGFLLGFFLCIAAGIGVVLTIAGLMAVNKSE